LYVVFPFAPFLMKLYSVLLLAMFSQLKSTSLLDRTVFLCHIIHVSTSYKEKKKKRKYFSPFPPAVNLEDSWFT